MSNCNICKRELSHDANSALFDCGGDCLRCMAVYGEDLSCMLKLVDIYESALVDIGTTSKGYPNGSREGQLAIEALGGQEVWSTLVLKTGE